MTNVIFATNPVVLTIATFVILMLAVEIPYQFGLRSNRLSHIDAEVWDTIQGGLLTLVAFVLGLSYAQAQSRFDARRDLVVREANAIGTTWLRADQLDAADAKRFRDTLTNYTRERLRAYSTPDAPALYAQTLADSDRQQRQLWRITSRALRQRPNDLGRSLLMATLNDTIDASAEQLAALTHHVPTGVLVLTFILVILGTITVGLRFARAKSRPLVLTIIYAAALTLVVNLVVDYDRAQRGLVRVPLDPLAIQLRSMQR